MLDKIVVQWRAVNQRVEDAQVLLDMAVEADDAGSFDEVRNEIKNLISVSEEMELKTILNDPVDMSSAYLSIHSGAGGTEACDWAGMLMRMYLRYAEKQGYKAEIMDMSEGDGAGIKSVMIYVEGPYAYGYLKAEAGVHRLVRISPFDSNARRHTSFAAVFAWPEVEDNIEIDIRSEDLKVDTYRSSGAGGQHVNKTESAIRITHIPSGIVVQCQSQRSQHANRDKAMKMLKSALYDLEMQKRNQKKDEMNATKKANEWGSQIRTYVMHPYQLVKDHRTTFETSQVQDVMDGDIQDFIQAELKTSMNKKKQEDNI